jgi:peptidyl-prolyl cis-trans isomerase A (cyclophilin A)
MKTARGIFFIFAGVLLFAPPAVFGQAKAPAKKSAAGKSAAGKTSPSKAAAPATDPALLQPATLKAQAPETFKVKFTTTAGDITIQVTRAWAPLGADRFYNLAKHHFFDGASFFRIVSGFVVQFGLSANPNVSKAWDQAKIKDDPVQQSNHRGYLTFATSGDNTRTTQLFINLGENGRLDAKGFSPFGQVSEGMDVVDKLYGGYGEKPDQGLITNQGKAYIDKNFPKLDKILSTAIEAPPAVAAPAKAPAKSPSKSTGKAPAKSTGKAPAKKAPAKPAAPKQP